MAVQPNNDTAVIRGVRTGLQTIVGTFVTFIVGLVLVVWKVPGVSDAVVNYVGANLPVVLLSVGIPTGLVSFVWNILRKDVRNW